eukprot:CAMPEP_0204832122 /NCGR_PEP_ID=MMETSP1346-20131115/12794_1 /ASSEMBLY_ACC=CAM_ASM_000771 /TAXON_ID=215587 /ORGANISM="Aplanochytrium stocchinoi, Strain GSBS06" /LENGTH=399 /DNA_ID=CAMNT_0051963749 /DNA_START=291 /DNA_END=1490 /DNA_ORIENTATION=+
MLLVSRQSWRMSSLSTKFVAADFSTRGLGANVASAADLVTKHPDNNITENIANHIGRDLIHEPNHPLQILKTLIFEYFDRNFQNPDTNVEIFKKFDKLPPVVPNAKAFDELLIPEDHVSRKPSDTYYYDDKHCLRPHTSAHQTDLFRQRNMAFLCAGDVYRRDEIDASHYPVFHQMEGARIFDKGESQDIKKVLEDLKVTLEGMIRSIFGDVECRWVKAYFPFTDPSLELEIYFNNEWLEVLGCGVVHEDILKRCGLEGHKGWAFGLGLERLGMVLFEIPDIRLFWTKDPRFLKQFEDGKISQFQPYSKYPPCFKDMTFWLPENYHINDLNELLRSRAGDLVEKVELIDNFFNKKLNRRSHCYRITYRSMDRSLTNAEVDILQEEVRSDVEQILGGELR